MRLHRPAAFAATLLIAVVLANVSIAPARAAASLSPQRVVATAAVTETFKVTLPETSIAGPGFDGKAIAWTGTDANQHLNISVGTNGVQFPTKTTLPETSPFGTAVAPVLGVSLSLPNAVAWTGGDANHSLNVQVIPGGPKLTLPESSIAAPALDFGFVNGAGFLLLAWTGGDANHSLNVLPLTVDASSRRLIPGTKTMLPQFSSDAGPSLLGSAFSHNNQFVLGWSARGTQQLNLAISTDGVHFTSAPGSGLPQTSASAPQFVIQGTSGMCMSWTGTDAANLLNVQCTTQAQFPQFPDPADTKTVLPETALGTPPMSIGGSPSFAEIAWTGTDAAHHLNVAGLQGP
jgi:hypothetical protein